MSNALLVSAGESESGRPLAVFGPQTGYFGPQPLIEMDIHGPSFDSRGAVVIGTPWVALGRGRDYAWSATSQGDDIQDTYALDLCEPDGTKPTIDSMHYRFRGQCLPIDVIEKRVSWQSNLVDSTPSGSATLRALRTKIGIGRRPRHDQGQAGALHAPALQLRPRDRRDGRGGPLVAGPEPGQERRRVHAPGRTDPGGVPVVLRRRQGHRLHRGRRPAGAAQGREPRLPDPLPAQPRVEGLQPGHARRTRSCPSSAGRGWSTSATSSTGTTSRPTASAPPTTSGPTARSTARGCSRTGSAPASRARAR